MEISLKRIFILLLMVMVVVSRAQATHEKGVVHVNSVSGSTSTSCGSNTLPCMGLKQAIDNCDTGGVVVVEGDVEVTSGIEITKDIGLVGRNGALLRGNSSQQYRFHFKTAVNISFTGLFFVQIEVYIKYESSFKLRSSITFNGCDFIENSGITLYRVDNTVLALKNSTFLSSRLVLSRSGKAYIKPNQLYISNCSFSDIKGGAVAVIEDKPMITIFDTSFKNCTTKDVIQKGEYHGQESSTGGAISVEGFMKRFRGSLKGSFLTLKKCQFDRNINNDNGGGDIKMKFVDMTVFEDCIFTNSRVINKEGLGNGGSVLILATNLYVSNCSFINCSTDGKGGAIHIYSRAITEDLHDPKKESWKVRSVTFLNANLENCLFKANKATSDGGAVSVDTGGIVKINSCVFDSNQGNMGGGIVLKMYKRQGFGIGFGIQTITNNCTFTNNSASVGGGVYIFREIEFWNKYVLLIGPPPPYSIQIKSCQFINNSASSSGQSVYSNDNIQLHGIAISTWEKFIAPHLHLELGKIELQNVTVKLARHSQHRLSTKSNGIVLKSSSIQLSKGLTILCPTNFLLGSVKNSTRTVVFKEPHLPDDPPKLQKFLTFLSIDCDACPFAKYNMNRGRYHLPSLSSFQRLPTIDNGVCMPCPTGAVCDVDVKAVDNFWGYIDSEATLSFELCPRGYCCGSETVPCTSFDTCAVGRKGTLCGTCAEGFKQNFVGGDCIPKGKDCDVNIFVTYFVVYTVMFTFVYILLTNLKDVVSIVKTAILRKNLRPQESDELADECNTSSEPFPIAGFVQIIIIFYQVAGLIHTKFQGTHKDKETTSGPSIQEKITDIFNFRFTVYQRVCPSNDLTLPQKEMILFGMKVTTFLILLLLLVMKKVIKAISCGCKFDLAEQTSVSEGEAAEDLTSVDIQAKEMLGTLSFSSMVKCTIVKLLKMYYTPIAKASLMMVHCVNVRGESHLYVYGDHVCYSPWQIAIMVILLPSLLKFPICFDLALRLLKQRRISSGQFVAATMCPFYGMVLYICKSSWSCTTEDQETLNLSHDEELFRRTVLQGEEFLFKEVKGRTVGWQIIQFYRTLTITFLNTFITNPMYRKLAYMALLLVFVVHDHRRQPYKHPYLNQLQSLNSRCLILVLICNVISAKSFLVNVHTIPFIHEVVKVSGVIELIVYAAVPASLFVWKLKTLIKNRRKARNEV